MYRTVTFLVALAALAASLPAQGPPADLGVPFLTNYSPGDYQAHTQNWAVVQDERGVLFFGNSNGVLEYDGVDWRNQWVPNQSIVRSLAIDGEGTIWVGAVDELGYLRRDAVGRMSYVSLLDRVDLAGERLGDVWRTFAAADGIYFGTSRGILRYREGGFRFWDVRCNRLPDAAVRGRIYCNDDESGLTVLDGERFVPVPGGEGLAGMSVMVILPRDDGGLLVGTRTDGLFVLRPRPGTGGAADEIRQHRFDLEPLPTEIDDELKTKRLYHGVALPDGRYALSTMSGGAFVVDADGRLWHRFDTSTGLRDDSVWYLHVDRQGDLRMALNAGIARVEISSPWTTFDAARGLDGTVEALARHEGTLYAATAVGLFALRGDAPGGRRRDRRFERVEGVAGPAWSLLADDGPDGTARLLIGTNDAVYELAGGAVRRVREAFNAFALLRPPSRPDVVLTGEQQGLGLLRRNVDGWIDGGRFAGLDEEIRSLAEDGSGALWLGTRYHGVIRLAAGWEPDDAVIERFGEEHGLPDVTSVKIHRTPAGRLLFLTSSAILEFEAESRRFQPSDLLDPLPDPAAERALLRIASDSRGTIWLTYMGGGAVRLVPSAGGGHALSKGDLGRISEYGHIALRPESNGVTWFGGPDGLFRFDTHRAGTFDHAFSATIRKIEALRRLEGSDGRMTRRYAELSEAGPVLAHAENSLFFYFAAASFHDETATRFSVFLDGYDDGWSEWGTDTKKEYTNLPEGEYRFRVRARNLYGVVGREAVYGFTVRPPWYRTVWARLAWVTLAAVGVAGIVRWRSRRLEEERDHWARQHAELSKAHADLAWAHTERETLIKELEARNAELERFTYTVSHDLKNPLVTIRGFLGLLRRDLASGTPEQVDADFAKIEDATRQMQQLFDELLELSRVGHATNTPANVHLGELVEEAVRTLAGEIAERGVEIDVAAEWPSVWGDRPRLLEIFQNLLGNAVKYMDSQPAPRVEVGATSRDREVECWVRDNGRGIDPRYHEKVFGLFDRLDPDGEGTGIGLALAKRIVEVHGGRIWVESEGAGCGSTFRFTLSVS